MRRIMCCLLIAAIVLTLALQAFAFAADSSGRITLSDLVLAARCLTGQAHATEEQLEIIDPDGNGQITLSDVVILAERYVAQMAGDSTAGSASPSPDPEVSSRPDPSAVPESTAPLDTPQPASPSESTDQNASGQIFIEVGGSVFQATLADNDAAREFAAMMADGPITIEVHDYAGFEKVGPLGQSLTENNTQITTSPGDVMLYNGNQIVLFYGTNTWSYTPLAKVNDLMGWKCALQGDSTVVVFSLKRG